MADYEPVTMSLDHVNSGVDVSPLSLRPPLSIEALNHTIVV